MRCFALLDRRTYLSSGWGKTSIISNSIFSDKYSPIILKRIIRVIFNLSPLCLGGNLAARYRWREIRCEITHASFSDLSILIIKKRSAEQPVHAMNDRLSLCAQNNNRQVTYSRWQSPTDAPTPEQNSASSKKDIIRHNPMNLISVQPFYHPLEASCRNPFHTYSQVQWQLEIQDSNSHKDPRRGFTIHPSETN
jgi:hypothetical protein